MVKDRTSDSDAFVTEVCWHYYVNEMTQAEIAEHLEVTRLRVNQAIQRARAAGIVKIQIESPFLAQTELQQALRDRYGLDAALVAPANPDRYDYHLPAGTALAAFLSENLKVRDWRRIGVSWGATIQRAIDRLVCQSYPGLEVISMIGGTTKGASFNSFAIASGLAQRLGASYSLLAAPIFLSDGVDRAAFLRQELFAEHFAKLEQLDVAILTASDVSSRSYLVSTGLPRNVTEADLTRAGAIGDVLGHFLDENGADVPSPLDEQTIGIALETLRKAPVRVLAAAGSHKVGIIRAAVRRGLLTTLITDDLTARLLLKD